MDLDWKFLIKNGLLMSKMDFYNTKITFIQNSSLIPALNKFKNGWNCTFLIFDFNDLIEGKSKD